MLKKLKASTAFILALLLSQVALASDAPVNNIQNYGASNGAACLTLPSANNLGIFALYGFSSSGGVADRLFKDGAFYQVPNGSHLEVICTVIYADTAGDRALLLSDDTTFAQGAALASLNAPLYQAGTTTNQYVMKTKTINEATPFQFPFRVDQNRFVGFSANAGNLAIIVVAKEVTP